MNEREYERMVAELERRYIGLIAYEAMNAVIECGNEDEARDRVTSMLLDDPAWTNVHATDISDIVYEAIDTAMAEGGI